jgi:hypothetical protein
VRLPDQHGDLILSPSRGWKSSSVASTSQTALNVFYIRSSASLMIMPWQLRMMANSPPEHINDQLLQLRVATSHAELGSAHTLVT